MQWFFSMKLNCVNYKEIKNIAGDMEHLKLSIFVIN